MKREMKIIKLYSEITFIEDNVENSPYLTEHAAPCILHLEMRVMLKIVSILIGDGLDRVVSSNERSEIQAGQNFLNTVQEVLSTRILGLPHRRHSYQLPFNKKTKSLGDINLNNGPCRKLLVKIDLLIDTTLTIDGGNNNGKNVEEEKKLWKDAMKHYTSAMNVLLSKVNVNEKDVIAMQNDFDMFGNIFFYQLGYGRKGMTNYLHMIQTGHLSFFLTELKCLYRFSQQGWEHLVGNIKKYVYRRSNRGGGRGTRNRLDALTHLRSRLFAYMTNETLIEMKQYLEGNKIMMSSEAEETLVELLAENTREELNDTEEDVAAAANETTIDDPIDFMYELIESTEQTEEQQTNISGMGFIGNLRGSMIM